MKEKVIYTAIMGLILSGCGGGESASEPMASTLTIGEKNQIHITGINRNDGSTIDHTVQLDGKNSGAVFYANANDPISNFSITPANDQLIKSAGYFALDNSLQQVKSNYLKYMQGDKVFGLSCNMKIADTLIQNNYSLTKNSSQSLLKIQLTNTPKCTTQLIKNPDFSSQPSYSSYDTDYPFTVASLDDQINAVETNANIYDAKISGELTYAIPNQWAVAKSNRFPVIDVKGQLSINGKTYKVYKIYNQDFWVDKYIVALRVINELGDAVTLYINEYPEKNRFNKQAGTYVNFSNNDQPGLYVPSGQKVWEERDGIFYLNLDGQYTDETGQVKVLKSNLAIPTLKSQLTINGKPYIFRIYNGKNEAISKNEQRGYTLGSDYDGPISITHEGKGHLSLKYTKYPTSQAAGGNYTCGSAEQACAGLTVDADQKTYHFNQVAAGDQILNGTLYIPGVFQ